MAVNDSRAVGEFLYPERDWRRLAEQRIPWPDQGRAARVIAHERALSFYQQFPAS